MKGVVMSEPALGNGRKIADDLPEDGMLNQPTLLAYKNWHQVSSSRPTMEDFTAEDWTTLSSQKRDFYAEHQAEHALNLLRIQENTKSFGYQVNNYSHCLQSATMALRDGCNE